MMTGVVVEILLVPIRSRFAVTTCASKNAGFAVGARFKKGNSLIKFAAWSVPRIMICLLLLIVILPRPALIALSVLVVIAVACVLLLEFRVTCRAFMPPLT